MFNDKSLFDGEFDVITNRLAGCSEAERSLINKRLEIAVSVHMIVDEVEANRKLERDMDSLAGALKGIGKALSLDEYQKAMRQVRLGVAIPVLVARLQTAVDRREARRSTHTGPVSA